MLVCVLCSTAIPILHAMHNFYTLSGFLENKWALLLLTDGEKWTFGEGTDILLSKPFLSGKAEGKDQS